MAEPLSQIERSAAIQTVPRQKLCGSADFRRIIYSTSFYCCGVSGFLFLYNLFLLDRGFLESSIGVLTSAAVIGTMAGTLPIGYLAGKFGTRRVMITCLWLVSIISALKAFTSTLAMQFSLDLLGGICVAGWAVGLAPLVAETVEEDQTASALSILFSVSIVSCAAAALIASRLPSLFQNFATLQTFPLSPLRAKQLSMLFLCVVGGMSAIPLIGLKKNRIYQVAASTRRISPFLWRFLLANALWALAIGCFNPFMSVYLTRKIGVALPTLGTFFSLAQGLQALAILAAPWLLRRFSLVASIVATQLVAAFALFTLSSTHGWLQTAMPLMAFMLAQHIVDPNMQTFLMNNSEPQNRSNGSAIYLLIVSMGQGIAGTLAGYAIARYSYATVFIAAAILAAIASASLFAFFEVTAFVASPSNKHLKLEHRSLELTNAGASEEQIRE